MPETDQQEPVKLLPPKRERFKEFGDTVRCLSDLVTELTNKVRLAGFQQNSHQNKIHAQRQTIAKLRKQLKVSEIALAVSVHESFATAPSLNTLRVAMKRYYESGMRALHLHGNKLSDAERSQYQDAYEALNYDRKMTYPGLSASPETETLRPTA